MCIMSRVASLLCLAAPALAWQGKNTIAASDPLSGLAFNLKYLPVAVAEDNGDGDIDASHMGATWVQGRASLILNGTYDARNCQLFSTEGEHAADAKYQSMTSNGVGKDCSYSNSTKYASGAELHWVFAHNRKQCCNACVATKGCVAATFLTSDHDHSGMEPDPLKHNWEGFAIHMADLKEVKATGGISPEELESHFQERLGDLSSFDQFLDYSVTFFTHSLQPYYDSFKQDGVPCLVAQWEAEDATDLWHSLFFLVPGSHYVIELASAEGLDVGSASVPQMEPRMSRALTDHFRGYAPHPANLLWTASINRATSNMSLIDDVYTNLFKATVTHEINEKDVVRRCYRMSQAANATADLWNQVCFTSRSPDAQKDKIFSVVDFERMLWAEHAATLGNDPTSQVDKYTDDHNGLQMNPEGISALSDYFDANNPYPITNETRLAYLCKQSYIIDPTGWSIMPVEGALWPGCFDELIMV